MLVLAHTGITLGAAVLVTGGLTTSPHSLAMGKEATGSPLRSSQSVPHLLTSPVRQASSWLTTLGKSIDIRLLLIGALLPDIIDKPLGHLFFSESLSNGRIFSHTLLFLIIVTLAGLYLYRRRAKLWLLVLAFGTLIHLILDQMWQTPQTLLWPLFGFTFPKEDITNWLPDSLHALLTDPSVYLPELLGAVILIWFAWILLRRRKVVLFIRHGRIQ
jgi:inner membrane protein